MSNNVLVTGAAGFLGSHLTDYLLNSGYNVVALDDLSGGFRENLEFPLSGKKATDAPVHHDCIFIQGSILDYNLVDHLFSFYRFDYCFHVAAYAAEALSGHIKRFNHTNNLIGSVNIINAAVKYGTKCFVFTSSMAVYGALPPPFTEGMNPHPEDSYGISKYAVEQELRVSNALFGLDYVIFRPHNIIGERQNMSDPYRNVAAIFMNQILHGQPMTIFGDGEQTRAFSYIGDIIQAIAKSPNTPAALEETFNIGGDQPCTINELATFVAEAMEVPRNVIHLPPRHEVRDAFCWHGKVNRLLGAQAQTPLREAIEKMAAWAKKKGPQDRKDFMGIEIEKNLPESWRR